MIATISGVLSEKVGGQLVIDVAGVGYGLYVTPDDHGFKTGNEIKLYVHEHIRENAYDLYGFSKISTKQLFEQLLSVNGVGPKMALAILSVGSADEVRTSIAGAEVKFLQAAPGVGRRVAERVVVDLKDKVGLSANEKGMEALLSASNVQDEAVQALTALGYTMQDALAALQDIDKNLPVTERVKQALRINK